MARGYFRTGSKTANTNKKIQIAETYTRTVMNRLSATDVVTHQVLQTFIRYRRELGSRDLLRVVLGVSGGLDSVVLLHALHMLRDEMQIELVAAHLDHGLRENSADDARFVSSVCASLNVSLVTKRIEISTKCNQEAWGREQRYSFFEEIMGSKCPAVVATAHHRDDLVETFYWRLLSNRLSNDLRIITECSLKEKRIRPLLCLSRAQILDYAAENNLSYTLDNSNFNLEFTRNKIRHELLPFLRSSFSPNLSMGAVELLDRLSEDEHILESLAEGELNKIINGNLLRLQSLLDLPNALQWRALRSFFVRCCGQTTRPPSYNSLARCLSALSSSTGGSQLTGKDVRRFEMNNGFVLCVLADGAVCWEYLDQRGKKENFDAYLTIPGRISFSLGEGRIMSISSEFSDEKLIISPVVPENYSDLRPVTVETSADCRTVKIWYFGDDPPLLCVKNRKGGESLRLGNRISSLKKIFQEKHTPHILRYKMPLVYLDNHLIWVPGVVATKHEDINYSSNKLCGNCALRCVVLQLMD